MSVDVTAEIIVDRPRAAVTAFAMNAENDPAWIGGVVESKMLSPGPPAKGTQVERVARFLGRRFRYVTEIVEYGPGQLAMRASRPFPMTISYMFEELDVGTLVRVQVAGGGSGFFRLAEPLLAPAVKRNVQRDLRTLKRILESREGG